MNIINEEIYYGCQLKVSCVGKKGQDILQKSKCAIIGMGGLGCPVAQYLVPSGIGYVGLYDSDVIDESNINRQVLYSYVDIAKKKVDVAEKKLGMVNPFTRIEAYDMRIDESNWKSELSKYDIIIDCTDNFFSKFLIHDAAMLLKKKMLQAGIFQTTGQVLYFNFEHNDNHDKACYRCVWDDIPPADKQKNCDTAGVLPLVAGNVGLMQANIAMMALLGMAENYESCMYLFDWMHLEWTNIKIKQRGQCMCNTKKTKDETTAYLHNFPVECEKVPQDRESFIVLDVRNDADRKVNEAFHGMRVVEVEDSSRAHLEHYAETLDKHAHYIVVCYKGVRSLEVTRSLRGYGVEKAQSLIGGYSKLSQ